MRQSPFRRIVLCGVQLRCTPRLGNGQAFGRRFPLPLPSTFRPESQPGTPLPHLAHIPDDWLENYVKLIEEEYDGDPDEQFRRRLDAICWLRGYEERTGADHHPGGDDAIEELTRRREAALSRGAIT